MIKQYFIRLINSRVRSWLEKSAQQDQKNILSLIETNKNAKLLDLGCGSGNWTTIVAAKINTKIVYGVDIDSRKCASAGKMGIIVKQLDLNSRLPFRDKSFDVVVSSQVIEHLHDTDTFVDEIHRILKKEGYAIISTENLSSWHNIFALILGWQPFSLSTFSRIGVIGNPLAKLTAQKTLFGHIKGFTYFALIDLLKHHRFTVERACVSGYYPFPALFARLDPFHGHRITLKVIKR